MDFIDRLAQLLSGSSVSKIRYSQSRTAGDSADKRSAVSETVKIEGGVHIVNDMDSILHADKIVKVDSLDESQTTLESYIESRRVSFGDTLAERSNLKNYNDIVSCSDIPKVLQQRDLRDRNLLYKIMPFMDSQTDAGDWVYKNRHGVIAAMLVYIGILSVMLFVNIGIRDANLANSIYIDVPYEEIEKLEDKKTEPELKDQSDNYDNQKVENVLVDKNMELDTKLKDDRNTKTSDLYREAQAAQDRLDANRQSYQEGLDGVSNIRLEENKSAKDNQNTQKSINKAGNVTVSYDLKGRYVVRPEIPAYRCKGAGKVVVNIVVGQNGKVVSASINSVEGVSDDCLPQMAVEAARLTEFNIDYNADKAQSGLISFVFVSQ